MIILAIFIVPVFIILSTASKKARERELDASRLSGVFKDELQDGIRYPVRYASKTRFEKIWKLFPWKDNGIMSIKKEAVTFYSKDQHKIIFPAKGLFHKWIGSKYWPNGVIAWFLIRYENTDHYFTSETGKWVVLSEATTHEIYEKLHETLEQPAQSLNNP